MKNFIIGAALYCITLSAILCFMCFLPKLFASLMMFSGFFCGGIAAGWSYKEWRKRNE
jgi:hypothetical protein